MGTLMVATGPTPATPTASAPPTASATPTPGNSFSPSYVRGHHLRACCNGGEWGISAVGDNFAKNSSKSKKTLNYRLQRHRRRFTVDSTKQETESAVLGATQLNMCALSFRGSLI